MGGICRCLPIACCLGEVMRRVTERLKERVLFTPLMWLGNSEHHLDFPGTMTAAPRVYLDLLERHGREFSRCTAFGGSCSSTAMAAILCPGQQAMFELRQKYRERRDLVLLSTTYWTLGAKPQQADEIARAGPTWATPASGKRR